MSENLFNELPVITSIDDLPETAIEELTDGQEIISEEKPAVKAATNPMPDTVIVEDASPIEELAPVKPKRKRRTKAEIEADKAKDAESQPE